MPHSPSLPASHLCDHSPSTDPRRRGVCVKCGRKLAKVGWVTTGEAAELFMLLENNARPWNRTLRKRLAKGLEIPMPEGLTRM